MSATIPTTFEQDAKKRKQESEKLSFDLAVVQQEVKEDNEEQAQKEAKAIREKNAETFFVRLQDTSEARAALKQEEEFYVTLRTRGVTLEDVQGLNANYERTLTPMFNSFAADIRREHEKTEKPEVAKEETAKTIHFDLTKITRSGDEEFARVFPIVDKDKNGKLDEAEFSVLKEKAHILSVSETLKQGARHFSEAISPVEIEKGKAEVGVGQ